MKRLYLIILIAVLAQLPAMAQTWYSDDGRLKFELYTTAGGYSVIVSDANRSISGSLEIPASTTYEGVTYPVTTIGSFAFDRCTGLTEVTIPNSVTSIGLDAFSGCTGLTEVTIVDGEAELNCSDLVFSSCPISKLYLGRNIAYNSSNSPFWNNSNLTSLTIGNSVTTIGKYAFDGCTGLTEVTIPNSVTTIGEYAFDGCTGLTSLTIGNSVTTIGQSAFRDCTGLTEVTIPNSVTTIDESAFRECTGLTDIVIHDGIKNIGSGAFKNTHIRTVTMKASNPIDIQNANPFDVDFVYALFVPTGSKRLYSRAKEWENFKNIFEIGPSDVIDVVKDGVRYGIKSEDTAFAVSPKRSERKSDIIINSTIEINGKQYPVEIADYAFDNVMEINTVEITDGIKVISPYAFHGSGIESVKLPMSVETIGSNAFAYSELTAIEIPNSVTSIGSEALRATKLTALNIPSSITQIPSSLCSECKQLKQINLGLSISDIGEYAFSGCTGLTAIHLPNSVKIIPTKAFSNTGIYELSVPNSVTTLEYMCFSNCEHLQRVEIVDGSEQLYINRAFSGSPVKDFYVGRDLDYSDSRNMTALETLRFGKSVNTIGNFNGCKNVAEIWCANPFPPAGPSDAFDGIGYTTCKLYVPVGSYTAYESTKPWSYILDIQEREFESGVENVTFDGNTAGDIDFNAPVEAYNLQGVMVGDNMNGLSAGIYIVRQGRNIKKIAVK